MTAATATGVPTCAFATADAALDHAERMGYRVRVHYGGRSDVTDSYGPGQDWGDVYDVAGYIGRSMGAGPNPIRARLIIANRASTGGGAILSTDHVVRVRFANRREGGDLYRHRAYLPPSRWDGYPDDLAAHRRDWARHFAADPRDLRGLQLDLITDDYRAHGIRYTLSTDDDGAFITITPEPDGVRMEAGETVKIDRAGVITFARKALEGQRVMFGANGLPYPEIDWAAIRDAGDHVMPEPFPDTDGDGNRGEGEWLGHVAHGSRVLDRADNVFRVVGYGSMQGTVVLLDANGATFYADTDQRLKVITDGDEA